MNFEKRTVVLGIPFHTARYRLQKILLFDCVKKLELDNCYRCGNKIEDIEQFSIEHKKGWVNSENPKLNFFDLSNIAYSHMKCNCANQDKKGIPKTEEHKEKLRASVKAFYKKKLSNN